MCTNSYLIMFKCIHFTGLCVRNEGQRDEKARLMVSNSVSIFDPLALHVTTLCISVSILIFGLLICLQVVMFN